MRRPGFAQKVAQIQRNPASMQSLMNDPDMQKFMKRIQLLSSGGGALSGNASASSSSASHHKGMVSFTSLLNCPLSLVVV